MIAFKPTKLKKKMAKVNISNFVSFVTCYSREIHQFYCFSSMCIYFAHNISIRDKWECVAQRRITRVKSTKHKKCRRSFTNRSLRSWWFDLIMDFSSVLLGSFFSLNRVSLFVRIDIDPKSIEILWLRAYSQWKEFQANLMMYNIQNYNNTQWKLTGIMNSEPF